MHNSNKFVDMYDSISEESNKNAKISKRKNF